MIATTSTTATTAVAVTTEKVQQMRKDIIQTLLGTPNTNTNSTSSGSSSVSNLECLLFLDTARTLETLTPCFGDPSHVTTPNYSDSSNVTVSVGVSGAGGSGVARVPFESWLQSSLFSFLVQLFKDSKGNASKHAPMHTFPVRVCSLLLSQLVVCAAFFSLFFSFHFDFRISNFFLVFLCFFFCFNRTDKEVLYRLKKLSSTALWVCGLLTTE